MEEIITEFLNNLGPISIIINCLLIFIEPILPILPVCVFIGIAFIKLGPVLGFIVAYILNTLGVLVFFKLSSGIFRDKYLKYIDNKESLNKITKKIKNLKSEYLVLIGALPFTPLFFINFACAISGMEFKKFMICTIISRISIILFFGFIGISFMDCLNNPIKFLYLGLVVVILLVISKIVIKKFGLNETAQDKING